MCRIEERVYIGADGHRSKFEDAYPCDKARHGRLCAKVKKRTTEYYPKKGTVGRNDTPSPINPPTPTGPGTYLVEQRRPSSSSSRPSTSDKMAMKPLIIEIGSKNDKGKKYASISVSGKNSKRISIGSGSIDDMAVDSPGSDASHTVRTGYPEASLPAHPAAYGHSDGYNTTPTISRGHGYHHRHTSSTSSYTGSSQTPSLYVTSDPDYDSPGKTRDTRLPPAIHNSSSAVPPSPSKSRGAIGISSGGYNITVVSPKDRSYDAVASDSLSAADYHDFADRSASSHAGSGASGKSRRPRDPEPPRKKRDEERRRQEETDRETADARAKDENAKQVRFVLGRAEGRAKERSETLLAEKEKQRAIEREEARRRERQDREDEAANERKKEKTRVPASNSSSKRPTQTRRSSKTMTAAEAEEQRRLLAADLGQMQGESMLAEARDREERSALLRQQQQDPGYYNPRAGGMPSNSSSLVRGDSVKRRGSISGADARPILTRSNSTSARRTSIVQPNPPQLNTQVQPGYSRPSARNHAPPPVSFPSNFNTRPTSSRRPSFSAPENPFAAPPTRGSGSSIDNPFVPAPQVLSPPVQVHQDPWDARSMRDALPTTRQTPDGRYTMDRRGADVLSGVGTHSAAREATRAMGRVAGFAHDFETDSEDEPTTHGHGRRRH
ncbi:hypothetical protein FB567DRAFT_213356 [Paraphoma chrysanthemicola]|uniref:Uncharacterized protein n=1 Tax=Paraphoma chrysanthemicola TaxID=798071 RepID=A0A8K0QVH8_9PLEO|nr:hypothetical protein FB567DRAFT_213356 [Paraphoma chrysanthemicola]